MRKLPTLVIVCILVSTFNSSKVYAPGVVIDPVDAYQIQKKAIVRRQVMVATVRSKDTTITVSRGGSMSGPIMMNVSAYTESLQDCGKFVSQPDYGVTASGTHVKAWHTIAASRSVPFGTKLYIPYFKDMPNKGIFVVEDRGGAIIEGHLDVYMTSKRDMKQFGRRMLEVYILRE